ncbi:MBL fold metallo-hydrolase [Candidatus Gracilibacteria bacterium]|nr:MBL fold metallo-hydrolase [Candidatus Gracilibacteria bacterium]
MRKKFLLNFFGILFILAVFVSFGFSNLPSGNLEVVFLDVGQGDAIFIRTPQNQKILIDAGPAGKILPQLAEELGFFERKIDLVIITHPDADHIAGFTEILKRFEIEKILLTGVQHETAWYADVLSQISEKEIPVILADSQTDLDFGGGVLLDIFWPVESLVGKIPADANAASIVARLIFGKTALILTGDLDVDSEKGILKTPQNLTAEVLKLGHHGAKTSSSVEFLAAVNPEIVIVSAGAENKFGHPNPEVLERLEGVEILETSKEGNIKIISDGIEWRS